MALGKNLAKPEPRVKKEKKSSKRVDREKGRVENEGDVLIEENENTLEVDDEAVDTVSYDQYCVFISGEEEYAIHINMVKEVVPFPSFARVPNMPEYIIGMANVRGNIYGIIDLASFFQSRKVLNPGYLLVLDHEEYQIGIAIPKVPDTLMVSEGMIESLSSSRQKSSQGQKYLKGIIKKDKRMIVQFDILEMISSDQFTVRS